MPNRGMGIGVWPIHMDKYIPHKEVYTMIEPRDPNTGIKVAVSWMLAAALLVAFVSSVCVSLYNALGGA